MKEMLMPLSLALMLYDLSPQFTTSENQKNPGVNCKDSQFKPSIVDSLVLPMSLI